MATGSWRQSSWKAVLFDTCHCQSLGEVSDKPTHGLSIMRLFGLTDRSYEALAVNLALKYCQWLPKTSLLWSALFRLTNSFTELNMHLALIRKWNHNSDAISECTWKAKADRLGSIIRKTSTFTIHSFVYCYRSEMWGKRVRKSVRWILGLHVFFSNSNNQHIHSSDVFTEHTNYFSHTLRPKQPFL